MTAADDHEQQGIRPSSPSQPTTTDDDDDDEDDSDDNLSPVAIVHANVAALDDESEHLVTPAIRSTPRSRIESPPQPTEVTVITLNVPVDEDRPPSPLPPKRYRRTQSQPSSPIPGSVRFNSTPTITTLTRRPTPVPARDTLRGSATYAALLLAYLCTGSLLLLVVWRWFPASDTAMLEKVRATDALTTSLWNLTLTYNVLKEDQWRQEAAVLIANALPNGKVNAWWHYSNRPRATWTSALLVCLSLITTTGTRYRVAQLLHKS